MVSNLVLPETQDVFNFGNLVFCSCNDKLASMSSFGIIVESGLMDREEMLRGIGVVGTLVTSITTAKRTISDISLAR